MKQTFVIIALLLSGGVANASLSGAPFIPEVDQRFHVLETAAGSGSDSIDGSFMSRKYSRATYDVAVDGASSTSSLGLGVYLPAKAIVTKVLYYIDTQFVDAGSGTIGIQCEDSDNIVYPLDVTGFAAGAIKNGVPVPATPTIVDGIAAQCELKAYSSGTHVPTAGKLTVFVEYFIKN